ncbi:MAG: amino acid decarboxylase [Solirubrobacteraceae bacterium]|nr:amino acid decarboxylase [Solirubrobacteraceae bacterium]
MGRQAPEQPRTPYLDAVVAYAFRGAGRWHVPGHKGGEGADSGLRHAIGDRALLADVPQDIRGIDVGPSPTPYEKAETLAAEAHGAARTWFLTNGATQGNHALTLALAPLGAPVVVQRNAHASVVDGLVLSGGMPTFVSPEYDEALGMAHGVTADSLAAALERTPGARAAFIVSPTYYGMVADVAACAEVAHAAGVPLIADQAWGGHFGFHPDLPASALDLGADAVLTSTHKMAGSMTQSAMLHVGQDSRVDIDGLARTVRLVRSTSPNSLLLGSLDASRRQISVHGEAILHETLVALRAVREKIAEIEGVRLVGEDMVGRPGVSSWDPLRITLDVRGTGRSGFEVADALRQGYDIHPELATHAIVVFVVGMAEPARALERLAGDLDETIKRIAAPGREIPVVRSPLHGQAVAKVAPRDAFLGEAEVVDVADAVGRISCESIAGYPPGIPALLPGEEITAETVRYLRELVDDGARLHGASDPAFRRVTVLVR